MARNIVIIGILAEGQKDDIKRILDAEVRRLNFDIETLFIERADDLSAVDALVLPRGKSLRFGEIMCGTALGKSIAEFSKHKPLLAICGSVIACTKRLGKGCEGRKTIGIIDAKVDNNCLDGDHKVTLANRRACIGNFTAAPVLSEMGKKVEAIAMTDGQIVAMKQGNIFGFCYIDYTGRSYDSFLRAVMNKQ